MSENINLNINISGQKEAEKTAKSVENIGKSANKTSNYMTDLRKQLREAKSAMLQAEEGSKAYNQALARVADIQFRIKDSGEKARLAIMDVGAVSKNVGGALAGIAGGFQTVAGAMTLFGLEGEASLKVIQNLTSIISVVQGLTAFADVIDNLRDLFIGMKASAAAAQGSIDGIGGSIEKLSPQVTNATTNLAGMTNVSNKLNDIERKSVETTMDKVRWMKQYSTEQGKSIADLFKSGQLQAAWAEQEAKNVEILKNQENGLKAVTAATQTAATGFKTMGKSILVSFGWTVVILAALAAITYGITKLIEKMNEIPKELEVRIALNEEVFKKMGDELMKVTKFANDYRNASIANDTERLKALDEIGKKEFGLSQKRLDNLKEETKKTNKIRFDAFDAYLKKAQAIYAAEARIKAGAEAEFNAKKAAAQRADVEEQMKQLGIDELTIKKIKAGLRVNASDIGLTDYFKKTKLIEMWNELNNQVIDYNKELRILKNIKIEPIDFGTGVDTKQTKQTTVTPKVEKVYWSASALKGLKEEMDRQIMSDIQKNIKEFQLQNIPKAPGFQIPKGEILGTTPEYYQKQLDTLQRSYDMGLTDYKDYLTVKSHILENAESFDIHLSETSFQTRMEIMQMERDAFEQRMQMYQDWTASLGEITDAISSIYDARMTSLDNYYNAEKALIEQSTMSEEQKNKRLNQLDQERYQKQKELFEQQKSWQIASVMLNLFGGLMGVFTRATTPVAMGGLPTPFNWITAGLEAAGLSATAIAQIANINAQQLEAPGGGGSAGGSAAPTAMLSAVSPTQTSTTSSAEILNKINKEADKPENVVKVSEINKVQTKTKVKETNQNY